MTEKISTKIGTKNILLQINLRKKYKNYTKKRSLILKDINQDM